MEHAASLRFIGSPSPDPLPVPSHLSPQPQGMGMGTVDGALPMRAVQAALDEASVQSVERSALAAIGNHVSMGSDRNTPPMYWGGGYVQASWDEMQHLGRRGSSGSLVPLPDNNAAALATFRQGHKSVGSIAPPASDFQQEGYHMNRMPPSGQHSGYAGWKQQPQKQQQQQVR